MATDIRIEMPSSFASQLQKLGNTVAKYVATEVRDQLTDEYRSSVERFYASYSPEYYERTWQLKNSSKPYYKNPHGTRYHGGVEITEEGMADTHHQSNSVILNNALRGIHGKPSIYTPPEIGEHMMKFQEMIYNNIESIGDGAIAKAKAECGF